MTLQRGTVAVVALFGAALFAPASAGASEVLVVGPHSVRAVDDPYLPPESAVPVAAPSPVGRAAQTPAPPPPPPTEQQPAPAPAPGGASTVRRALADALAAGLITQAQHDDWGRTYGEARSVRKRLPRPRRRELGSVVGTLDAIARRGQLDASRMPALFLTLERNLAFWRARPFPGAGARLKFGSSPVIFQYYPGNGLQIQPVANFLEANAYLNNCEGIYDAPCPRRRLSALLEAMRALASKRAGFSAWEYLFTYSGGAPPWISGMSQGAAVGAYSRASKILGRPDYLELAQSALGIFELPPPVGVQVPAEGGAHYLIYSFDRQLLVLNGFLQSVVGLFDYARHSGDPRGQALFAAGEAAALAAIPKYDTGAWSLYALGPRGGKEASIDYHRLSRFFIRNLCDRTRNQFYCETDRRWTRYLFEKPKIQFLGAPGARAGRTVALRFQLSKRSTVSIQVTRGGRVVHSSSGQFAYGTRAFGFRPPRAGSYGVRLRAVDVRNHPRVTRGSFSVAG